MPDTATGSGGNLALKDIAMGLHWVRENIRAFGGDPTRITLMGHDTGAALVNLLLLSPFAKGCLSLFVHGTNPLYRVVQMGNVVGRSAYRLRGNSK